jgi:hypothetical protein
MTQLSDKEHNVQMEDMKSFDEQMPCVGIFWYDPEDNTLFGVRKKELTPQMVEEAAEKGKPFINYPQGGHKAAIEREESEVYFDFPEREQARAELKEYFRAQAKHLDTKFKGDYTQVPRGRVAWTIDKFIVLVGKWAEPIQEQLTELLEQEFSLPYFEFVYDEPMEQREESQACLGYPES